MYQSGGIENKTARKKSKKAESSESEDDEEESSDDSGSFCFCCETRYDGVIIYVIFIQMPLLDKKR
jgi:hypothetical protein